MPRCALLLSVVGAYNKGYTVLRRAGEMANLIIVFEVVYSEGCNSQHKVGTKFFFSSDGNLLSRMSPPKVCAFVLPFMVQIVFAIQGLMHAGIDPNQLCFNRASCFDVGVQCGGWGRVVVEAKVLDRQEAKKLHASW